MLLGIASSFGLLMHSGEKPSKDQETLQPKRSSIAS